jgi:ACR3 family arsenite transporter
MSTDAVNANERKMTSIFERYLSVWVLLCIIGGILLGKIAPGVAQTLDGMAITVNGAPVVSIPIAVCLFFIMYTIMVKIDFGEVIKAGKSGKPVFLTLFINWAVKPFTMYAIALLFLGTLFYGFRLSVRMPWLRSKCPLVWIFPWEPPMVPVPLS